MTELKISLNLILTFLLISIINSETIWRLSLYSPDDISHKNPNIISLNKGTYLSFNIVIENINPTATIQHINSYLSLNVDSIKMYPKILLVNTAKSLEYKIDIGISCKTEITSNLTFSFKFDDDYSNIIEISDITANILNVTNILSLSILNTKNIYYKTYTKFLYKQNLKNSDDISLVFGIARNCRSYLKFNNINIGSFSGDLNYYYSTSQSGNSIRDTTCTITVNFADTELEQCFKLEENEFTLTLKIQQLSFNKNPFYHNTITTSYIDNNGDKSISLLFYKDILILSQFCVMQDKDVEFVSDDEILNQRISVKNDNYENISAEFSYQIDKGENMQKIDFGNFENNKNYKIKCIFEYLDNLQKVSITFGDDMIVPIKINFNHTKDELNKNICNNKNIKSLDTRDCDRANKRLNIMNLNFSNWHFDLDEFNLTNYENYLSKNKEEKITYIKNLLNEKKDAPISTISDYLFVLDCEEDKNCIESKYDIFLEIIKKFPKVKESLDNNVIKQDILLFNNFLQNSDCINYTNFEEIFNSILDGRRLNKYKDLLENEANITNIFILLYDRFLSMTSNFKIINKDKFPTYSEISLINNNFLNIFYLKYLDLISAGIPDQYHLLNEITQNFKTYQYYLDSEEQNKTNVTNNTEYIYSDENILIQGLENTYSQKVFHEVASISVITYNNFPLNPYSDKFSENAVNLFLYKNNYRNRNFKDDFVTYSSTFKFIFKNINDDRYCYLINKKYLFEKDDILSNFISTEYRKNDIVCVSEVVHSPMTVLLGSNYNGGVIYKEGICFSSVITTILICLGFVVISFPFIAKKYVFKNRDNHPLNEFQMK